MKKFYINTKAQSNGDHEVHESTCNYLPSVDNRKYLGEFFSCDDAVAAAERSYTKVNGCYHCAYSCHTS